jgi:shikimate kinase/3-dehydroquinate synthase
VVTELAGARPAELLARRGEPAFRQIEATAVESVLTGPPAVVATGGGAACQPGAMARLLSAGLVVALDVPLADALARAGSPDERPLLARSPAEVAALYAARQPIYRRAHAVVPVAGQRAENVAHRARVAVDRAGALGELLPCSVLVSLADRTYPVAIGTGALARLGELARGALGADVSRLALVSDSNVAPLHGGTALSALAAAGFDVVATTVPAGETAKSLDSFGALQELLVGAGLDRSSAIVALGGGVVGDLAGFAAATLYRGVPCIQVPTTLLAMVDSAIGGKTGINLEAGKNLVGAFHQPRLVLCDPALLATLPARERRAAYGELVKYGLLDGEELYGEVDRLAGPLGADSWSEPDSLVTVIRRSVAIKAAIVAADEREAARGPGPTGISPDAGVSVPVAADRGGGDRALLNLGHTVGHAIEAAAGYGSLLHGEAVALGLVAACRISAALGLCEPALERRVAATLARAGLDTDLEPWLRPDVLDRIGVDKKRTGTRIRFVVLEGPGGARLVPLELVRLREILAAPSRL